MSKIRTNLIIFLFTCVTLLLIFFGYGLYVLFGNKDIVNVDNVEQITSYNRLYEIIKNTAGSNIPFWRGQIEDALTNNESTAKYSNTNIQVAGVDEADIVKTDGEYIYALNNQYVFIINAIDGKMRLDATIKTESLENNTIGFQEMYLYQNHLIIIQYENTYMAYEDDEITPNKMMPYFNYNNKITTIIYDVTDKTKPVKVNELSQTGSYVSSRMIDSNVYIVTNEYVYNNAIKEDDPSTYVPQLENGTAAKSIDAKDIYVMPNPTSNSFVTIASIDVLNPIDFSSVKSVLGSSGNIYSSLDNLYVVGYFSKEENGYIVSKTNILKFALGIEDISLRATGSVNGTILNQFSMDENNGYFRIVTTSNDYMININENVSSIVATNEQDNNLYVLDRDLNLVGKLEGLAKGERVYSVRFDNDIAYFVTFRNVDPLFAVDLSKPFAPLIISELKIPGFSEYLHVYNEKYLFGLGKDVNEEASVIGTKISMFDIADKTNISEKFKTLVSDQFVWTEASYNHKAILLSSEKSLIAFPVENYYVIYSFNEIDGFNKLGEIHFDSSMWYSSTRGLYINDYIYAYNQHEIKSFDINKLGVSNTLILIKQ